jgi:hypothetical protein
MKKLVATRGREPTVEKAHRLRDKQNRDIPVSNMKVEQHDKEKKFL